MMPKKVALLIGVSEYGEGIPSLSAPILDVKAIERVLQDKAMGGFDEVQTLLNPYPTAMQLAIQKIFASCGKDDLVLLFFSGHGIIDDDNKLYFATKDTSKDFYEATSVEASFIQRVSRKSYCKRQAIVLDCCYSGAFAEGWQAKSIGLNLEQELGAKGRVVLTSSSATQKSFQQTGEELSLYTKYFVEGIETGAARKKEQGKIYASELHKYAKAKVQEAKPKQQPKIITDGEGYDILLSQAPINDPELDFRQLVEKYAARGVISVPGKHILEVRRQKLGITEEKSQAIINEVLAPYRQHSDNKKRYRQAFTETVKQHYPLTAEISSELQDFQDVLGLENKDVAAIKKEIIVTKAKDYFNRAVDKQNKGDYQEAIADYDRAIKLKPEYADVYYNRGNAYKNIEEYSKAIADYDRAIKLKPEYANAYNNRGNLHRILEDKQAAIRDYRKAAELYKKHGKIDDYEDAINRINKLQ